MWKHRADVSSHHNALSALVCLTRFVLVFVQDGVSINFTRASPAELNYFKAGPVHGIFAGHGGHVFTTINSTNPRSCKNKVAKSPSFTICEGEHVAKMCTNRVDGASGTCEREISRRLVATRE